MILTFDEILNLAAQLGITLRQARRLAFLLWRMDTGRMGDEAYRPRAIVEGDDVPLG